MVVYPVVCDTRPFEEARELLRNTRVRTFLINHIIGKVPSMRACIASGVPCILIGAMCDRAAYARRVVSISGALVNY